MQWKTITLDARAQHRLCVLNHVLTGEITAAVAAGNLKVTVRTVRRLLAACRTRTVMCVAYSFPMAFLTLETGSIWPPSSHRCSTRQAESSAR